MFPYLTIGPFRLPMFWIMIWLGIVALVITTLVLYEKVEKTEKRITNRILIISAVGLAALYAFAFFFNSLFHTIANKKLTIGGITWLGGVLGAFPLMVVMIHFLCPRTKGHALFYFDLLIPAIVLAHAFGRVGCFCAGCCFGGVTDSVFGISFPDHSAAAHLYPAEGGGSLPVYPTQLFEAVFELCLFAVMMIFYKRLRTHFLKTYCFAYGVFRFLIEFLRGDNRGSTGFALSPSQVMSLILLVIGVLLILYERKLIFKRLHEKMEAYRAQTAIYGVHVEADVKKALRNLEALQKDGVITMEEYEQVFALLDKRKLEKPIAAEKNISEGDEVIESKNTPTPQE